MGGDESAAVEKHWARVERIFRAYLCGRAPAPHAVVHNECRNIHLHGLAPAVHRRLVRCAKSTIRQADPGRELPDVLEWFEAMQHCTAAFRRDAAPLIAEGDVAARRRSLRARPSTFRNVVRRALRRKLLSVSGDVAQKIVDVFVEHRDRSACTPIVRRALRLFSRYRLFHIVQSSLASRFASIFSAECRSGDLDTHILRMHGIACREDSSRNVRRVFQTLERVFLAQVVDSSLSVFFRLKTTQAPARLAELYVRGHGEDALYGKIEHFVSECTISCFMDCHRALERLNAFSRYVGGGALSERVAALASKVVTENEDAVVPSGIETVAEAYLAKTSSGPTALELCRSLATVLKFASKKEVFDSLLRARAADFLLRNDSAFPRDFLQCSRSAGIGSNWTYKLEVMCEEAETRIMASAGEILYVRSCFWPRYKSCSLGIPELESIKRKFAKEERRKNPRVAIKFVDAVSLCEVSVGGRALVVTLVQYRILSLVAEERRTRQELEALVCFENFAEHYEPLLRCRLLVKVGGRLSLSLQSNFDTDCLPASFGKQDEQRAQAHGGDTDAEKRGAALDCEIMSILKREKRTKEAVLCRRLRARLDFFTLRVNLLAEKAYLKREDGDLVYIP